MMTLYEEYTKACNIESDINEHLPVLKKYADLCKHITEFGVRDGVSTRAFLVSKANTINSFDISKTKEVDYLMKLCSIENRVWNFFNKNTLECSIDPTDLLFIDDFHSGSHVSKELERHSAKVKRFIIFHDTVSFGLLGQNSNGKPGVVGEGLLSCIDNFLFYNKFWHVKEVLTNNNGLLVLQNMCYGILTEGK